VAEEEAGAFAAAGVAVEIVIVARVVNAINL